MRTHRSSRMLSIALLVVAPSVVFGDLNRIPNKSCIEKFAAISPSEADRALAALTTYSAARYGKTVGPALLSRLQRIGPGFENLVSDIGLVFRIREFEDFVQAHPAVVGDFAAARSAFAEQLGTTTVYRGMALKPEEYHSVLAGGLTSPVDRYSKKDMGPVRDINQLIIDKISGRLLAKLDESQSVTSHPIVARTMGSLAQYLSIPMMGTVRQTEKNIYVFRLNIPEIDLIYYNVDRDILNLTGTEVENYLGQQVRFDFNGAVETFDFGRGVESFVVGHIGPERIDVKNVEQVHPVKRPSYTMHPRGSAP